MAKKVKLRTAVKDSGPSPLEHFTNVAAARHAELYNKTRDGLLIWRCYYEYRKVGLPVPETILLKFDEIAGRLFLATDAREVANALQMATKKGGAAGASRTKRSEIQRDIIEYVNLTIQYGPKQSKKQIYSEVAGRYGYTAASVKKLWLAAVKK